MSRIFSPLLLEDIIIYITNILAKSPPNISFSFILYYINFKLTNIIVLKNRNIITRLIDWKSIVYYLQFWIATKPVITSAF